MLYSLPEMHGKSKAMSVRVPIYSGMLSHDQLQNGGLQNKSVGMKEVESTNEESKKQTGVVKKIAAQDLLSSEPMHGFDDDTSAPPTSHPSDENINDRAMSEDSGVMIGQDSDNFRDTKRDGNGIGDRDSFFEVGDENDPTSHAAMSKRAEDILANAKKRLNVSPHYESATVVEDRLQV